MPDTRLLLQAQGERIVKEFEVSQQRTSKLQSEYEQLLAGNELLSAENQSKMAVLRQREDDLQVLRIEKEKITKMKDQVQRKLHAAEDQKADVDHARERLRNDMSSLEKQLEELRKFQEADKKALEESQRERDRLRKELLKAGTFAQKQIDTVKTHEQTMRYVLPLCRSQAVSHHYTKCCCTSKLTIPSRVHFLLRLSSSPCVAFNFVSLQFKREI